MAADASVVGEFDLRTPALAKLRALRVEGERVDKTFARAGRTLDRVGGPVAERQLASYRREVGQLGATAKTSFGAYRSQWQASDRQVRRSVARQKVEIQGLRRELRGLSRQRVSVRVDLTGVAKALSDVELLMKRLSALDRRSVRANVSTGGSAVAGAAGAAGSGAVGGGGRALRVGGLRVPRRVVAGLAAVALPAVTSLTGAVTALVGSLASATVGFGAVGAAAAAAGSVGIGTFAAAAVPAIGRIREAYEAQTGLTEARQDDRSAAMAQKAGTDQVRSAQERLAGSQRSVLTAQRQLTDARRAGRRELVNMALAADRSRLSERRAGLEVKRARSELRRVTDDASSGGMARSEARLALEEALLGQREAKVERGRATADASRAKRGGVEGLPSVESARAGAGDSRRELANARRGLKEAGAELSAGASAIAKSKQELDQAFARAPRGTRALIRDMREMRRLWGGDPTASGPAGDPGVRRAQEGVVGIMGGGARGLSRMTPTLGRAAETSVGAVGREGKGFGRFLTGDRSKDFIGQSADMFDENLRNIRLFGQYGVEAFMNVSVAARPFFLEGTDFLKRWSRGWATGTRDMEGTRQSIGTMVDDLRAWKDLGGATVGVMRALFRAGRGEGSSMVESLTQWLETQEAILNTASGQARLRRWFRDSVESVKSLASSLWQILKALGQIGEALRPLLDLVTRIITLAGGAGLLQPGAMAAGLGAYGALRGRGKGGGAGGGLGKGAALAGGLAAGGLVQRGVHGQPILTGRERPSRARGALGRAGGVARGAAGKFLPVAAAFGALEFAGTPGTFGERSQNALSSMSMGAVPRSSTAPQRRELAQEQVGEFTGAGSGLSLRRQVMRMDRELVKQRRAPAPRGGVGDALKTGALGKLMGFGGEESKARKEVILQLERERAARAKVLEQDRAARSRENAQKTLGQIQEGGRRVTGREGAAAGARHVRSQTYAALPGRNREGKIELAKATLREAKLQAIANPKMWKEYDRLRRGLARRMGGMRGDFRESMQRLRKDSQRHMGGVADSMRDQARRGVSEASAEYKALNREAMKALRTLGYSQKDAKGLISGLRSGNTGRRRAAEAATGAGPGGRRSNPAARGKDFATTGRATGGRLPGQGLQDTVPMNDGGYGAPGELIVNRHTESDVDRDLRQSGRPSLDQRVKREGRRHSAPERGPVRRPVREAEIPFHAIGGRLYAAGGRGPSGIGQLSSGLMGAKPGLSGHASKAQRYGLRVTSGLRRGSITGAGNVSMHSSGDAIDVAAPMTPDGKGRMLAYARSTLSQYGAGLDELIHTPMGKAIKNGKVVPPYAQASHHNHVHLGDRSPSGGGAMGGAMAGGLGAAMAQEVSLKARKSRLGGVTGALSGRASELYAAGLEKQVNKALTATASAPGGGAAAAGGRAPEGQVKEWLTQALNITGKFSPANLNALYRRAMQESGGDASAQNNWDSNAARGTPSIGLLQTIGPTFQAHKRAGMDNIRNPVHNAVAAINYMYSRYGRVVDANGRGYETGGRMKMPAWGGWAGAGGEGSFSSPTMLGVGDGQPTGGSERVSVERVRPGGRPGGRVGIRDVNVSVKVAATVNGEQDMDALGERVADTVARKLTAALAGLED